MSDTPDLWYRCYWCGAFAFEGAAAFNAHCETDLHKRNFRTKSLTEIDEKIQKLRTELLELEAQRIAIAKC